MMLRNNRMSNARDDFIARIYSNDEIIKSLNSGLSVLDIEKAEKSSLGSSKAKFASKFSG